MLLTPIQISSYWLLLCHSGLKIEKSKLCLHDYLPQSLSNQHFFWKILLIKLHFLMILSSCGYDMSCSWSDIGKLVSHETCIFRPANFVSFHEMFLWWRIYIHSDGNTFEKSLKLWGFKDSCTLKNPTGLLPFSPNHINQVSISLQLHELD